METFNTELQGEFKYMKIEVATTEKKVVHLEHVAQTMKEVFMDLDKNFDQLQAEVENIDTLVKKKNIKLQGLKEGLEGRDVIAYLVEHFSGWVGSDCGLVITISAATRVGPFKPSLDIHEIFW